MIKTTDSYYNSVKIMDLDNLHIKISELQKEGKKIGYCSGSFDLLHPGHITHLVSAKKKCDVLIVAIARDSYNVIKTQRSGRPVYNEKVRAYCVSQLEAVNFVTFNDGEDITLLKKIKPDLYIKGADYAIQQPPSMLVVFDLLKEMGKGWAFTDDEKLSTSELIEYIKHEIK